MGLFNPLTFGRKHRTAWNALIGWYTFRQLNAAEQHLVLARVDDILRDLAHTTRDEVVDRNGQIVFLNFLVYGMTERGIPPAIPGERWFHVKNPFVESIGAEEMVTHLRPQLEKRYGVSLEIE